MTERPVRKARESKGPSREATLRAALEIIDADGIEGLSMRGLGHALGCDPMSLYRHAATKAALLDLVAESVLAQLSIDVESTDWAGQLRSLARQFRGLALAHPNLVSLLVTRPLSTPIAMWPLGTLRPLESVLELLNRAGFTEADALRIYRLVYGSMQGHVLNELQTLVATMTRRTPCCGWACTACHCGSSLDFAASPRFWPPMTAQKNSNDAWTSCSRASTSIRIPTAHSRGCLRPEWSGSASAPLRYARCRRGVGWNYLRVKVTMERVTGIEPALSAWEALPSPFLAPRLPGVIHWLPGVMVSGSHP